MILALEGLRDSLAGHVEQVVDEGEVVDVDSRGEVWAPGPHEEIHIAQVGEEPAAHKEGTHGSD